jgi:alpha-1,6-mannosyltransferase
MNRYFQTLFLLTLLLLIVVQALLIYSGSEIETYTVLFISASAIYLLLIYFVFKVEISNKQLLTILISLFLVKTIFVNTDPIGSDDYYRYIWDGKVHANGINPYLYKPDADELKVFQSDLLPDKVSYPHIKTIYFPVSQWIFVIAYWISGENAVGLKIIYLLFELITLIALYFLLKYFNVDLKYLLIYAALPLITFQFFIDAHIDIAGTALMISSIAFYFYNKKLFSYILLGLSLSVKPTGLLLLPFYFQNEAVIKEKLKSVITPIVVFVITFLPYLFTATPLDTLINYSVNWTFNGMIYNTLNLFISDNSMIRILCGILFILVFRLFVLY